MELQATMTKRTTGAYENVIAGGEDVPAFLPYALPPRDPAFAISEKINGRLRAAEQALVRLGARPRFSIFGLDCGDEF